MHSCILLQIPCRYLKKGFSQQCNRTSISRIIHWTFFPSIKNILIIFFSLQRMENSTKMPTKNISPMKETWKHLPALTCISFPSATPALPPANTPSRMMGLLVGSCFSSDTLIMALGAERSDSTAAASSRPVWPNATCEAAMSSHGQSPAKCCTGTLIALAAAAGPGHTLCAIRPIRAQVIDRIISRGHWHCPKTQWLLEWIVL